MSGPLSAACGVREREVITIVGGGGKTTTLFRLGRELHGRSGVVVTTTTHIMLPPLEPDLETIVEPEAGLAAAACRSALARGHLPVLGTRVTAEGRLGGVAPEVVDLCAGETDLARVVVEADGSAHKPFKAPLAYEPVVPRSTTLLVAVIGVDALGAPLDADHIHRPERVAELSGAVVGEPVTAETIARVMVHPAGPLRDAPPEARVVILLNKADTDMRRAAALEIADAVRAHRGPPTLIGAVAAAEPFA